MSTRSGSITGETRARCLARIYELERVGGGVLWPVGHGLCAVRGGEMVADVGDCADEKLGRHVGWGSEDDVCCEGDDDDGADDDAGDCGWREGGVGVGAPLDGCSPV